MVDVIRFRVSIFVQPDDLPHDYILGVSKPYLGNFISTPSDWTPLKERKPFFGKYSKPDLDLSDPWQFKNFLITTED